MGKKRVVKKTQQELIEEEEKITKKLKKDILAKTPTKKLKVARIYISSTYNNTIVSLTDEQGSVLMWRSAGNMGFKGTKKGTSFAASKVAQAISSVCSRLGLEEVHVFVKGVGGGRTTALRTIASAGLNIQSIKDITPIPHNGGTAPKGRRV